MTERDRTGEAAEKFARIETAVLDHRCSPLMVSILVTLSNYATVQRIAWPSYESLAFITGAAIQNVRLAVERLEALGYIVVERDDQPGRTRVNHYHLQLPPSQKPIATLRAALKVHRDKEEKTRRERHKGAREHSRSELEKQARQRLKQARSDALTGMLPCPDPLEPSLEVDPSSDPTGSAAAVAPASSSRRYAGAAA